MNKSKIINEKLGVKIFNESIEDKLVLNKFSKKQIKDLCIDDLIVLINKRNRPTTRLLKLSNDILAEVK